MASFLRKSLVSLLLPPVSILSLFTTTKLLSSSFHSSFVLFVISSLLFTTIECFSLLSNHLIHHHHTYHYHTYHYHNYHYHSIQNVRLLSTTNTPSSESSNTDEPLRRRNGAFSIRTGPKADSSRRRSSTVSKRSSSSSTTTRRRRSTDNENRNNNNNEDEQTFDPKLVTKLQIPNENAPLFDLYSSTSSLQIKSSSSDMILSDNNNNSKDNDNQHLIPISHSHIEYISLDGLFPNLNFSSHFSHNSIFRQDIRQAIRKDIFFTTPAYANLSSKVVSYMLDDDSSLQGSWNCISSLNNKNENNNDTVIIRDTRMNRLTKVLHYYLGDNAPSGDEFMMKIGSLCGKNPSTHWIDIIGVKKKLVSHSWHQDSGRSYDNNVRDTRNESRFTIMLGFPQENEYEGTGIFSHVIKLTHECLAPSEHNANEPVLFQGIVDEEFIVRPCFSLGREIIKYRDVDVLHSAPDVVYRKSVMRFM